MATKDGQTEEYQALKQHLQELRTKAAGNALILASIYKAEQDAAKLEALYIKDMRVASTEITKGDDELRQHLSRLMERYMEIKAELDAVMRQSHGYGIFLRHLGYEEIEDREGNKHVYPWLEVRDEGGRTHKVLGIGNKEKHIEIKPEHLRYGQKLVLLEMPGQSHAIEALDEFYTSGRDAQVTEVLEPDQYGMPLMVSVGDLGEKQVAWLGANVAANDVRPGSRVLVNPTIQLVTQILPEEESSRYLVAAGMTNVRFEQIGGLESIVEEIKQDFAWPIIYPEKYQEIDASSLSGLLLCGPPGVGKTLIAKALVNFMDQEIEKATGKKGGSIFYNINGPELLDKYIGETEKAIRHVFAEAKTHASPMTPVIIYFDEMDSMFGARGSGISSDVEKTHVPQLCSEMDGLEARGNVIVVGSSNRAELIDPAILRPGRMSKKIFVPRPDAKAAKEIFRKYLKPVWGQINPRYNDDDPYIPVYSDTGKSKGTKYYFNHDPEKVLDYLITRAVERMYDTNSRKNLFISLRYEGKLDSEILRFGDFASGAMIADIVDRAKKFALRDNILYGARLGVEMTHLFQAIEAAFAAEQAPRTTTDDLIRWLSINGKLKGRLAELPKFMGHDVDVHEF